MPDAHHLGPRGDEAVAPLWVSRGSVSTPPAVGPFRHLHQVRLGEVHPALAPEGLAARAARRRARASCYRGPSRCACGKRSRAPRVDRPGAVEESAVPPTPMYTVDQARCALWEGYRSGSRALRLLADHAFVRTCLTTPGSRPK